MSVLAAIAIFTLLSPAAASQCNWGFSERPNGDCYLVVNETIQRTWEDARQYCKTNYAGLRADLVRFEDQEDEDSVTPKDGPLNYWIGLHELHHKEIYVWLDDVNETSYTNWPAGEQLHFDCVSVGAFNGNWSKTYCNTTLPFICGYTPESQEGTNGTLSVGATGCPSDWEMIENVGCIRIFRDAKRTWTEAREHCQNEQGGDLMVVPDLETHKLVRDFFKEEEEKNPPRRRYWFGLSRQEGDDSKLMWLDTVEKDAEFSRWCRQPDADKNLEPPYCGLLVSWKHGRWNTGRCGDQHYSVCMKKESIENLLPEMRNVISSPIETQTTTEKLQTDEILTPFSFPENETTGEPKVEFFFTHAPITPVPDDDDYPDAVNGTIELSAGKDDEVPTTTESKDGSFNSTEMT